MYDILCLLRGMAIDNASPKLNRLPIQVANNIPNGETPSVSSPEEVFSIPDSMSPISPDSITPKVHLVCYSLSLIKTNTTTYLPTSGKRIVGHWLILVEFPPLS